MEMLFFFFFRIKYQNNHSNLQSFLYQSFVPCFPGLDCEGVSLGRWGRLCLCQVLSGLGRGFKQFVCFLMVSVTIWNLIHLQKLWVQKSLSRIVLDSTHARRLLFVSCLALSGTCASNLISTWVLLRWWTSEISSLSQTFVWVFVVVQVATPGQARNVQKGFATVHNVCQTKSLHLNAIYEVEEPAVIIQFKLDEFSMLSSFFIDLNAADSTFKLPQSAAQHSPCKMEVSRVAAWWIRQSAACWSQN